MPFIFAGNTAIAEGAASAEDALTLVEFLQSHRNARFDLGSCGHVHTAVVQLLMATRPEIVALPREAFLSRWLSLALATANMATE
jgi:hypothetical protein